MRKDLSQLASKEEAPVTSAVFVERAQSWARELEAKELPAAGSIPAARQAVERRHRLPSGLLYSLRYRPPKRLAVDAYERLRAALIAACEQERRRLEHEITIARAAGVGADHPALAAAEAAAGDPGEA
jgi:hypothetical protein